MAKSIDKYHLLYYNDDKRTVDGTFGAEIGPPSQYFPMERRTKNGT